MLSFKLRRLKFKNAETFVSDDSFSGKRGGEEELSLFIFFLNEEFEFGINADKIARFFSFSSSFYKF